MAAKEISAQGSGTLSASGPGEQASSTVTDSDVNTTDRVFITETTRIRDAQGPFKAYIASVHAGSFTVKSDRDQLPEDLTFSYIAVTTA